MKKILLSISIVLWVTQAFGQPWNTNYGDDSGILGSYNSFFGNKAGGLNSGQDNSYVGALSGATSGNGNRNSALGSKALHFNTEGSDNTALGMNSMFSNDGGSWNTAAGSYSLFSNKSGTHNIAMGMQALYSNTESHYNVALGSYSMYHSTVGRNTAVGFRSMYSNKTGQYNVAAGSEAMHNNETGFENTAIGHQALYKSDYAIRNVAVGAFALSDVAGHHNVAVGVSAGNTSESHTNFVAIGYGTKITLSNQVRLGNSWTVSIGGYAPWSNLSDGRFKRDIKEDIAGLDFINKLRPVSYTIDRTAVDNFLSIPENARLPANERKDKKERQVGFIAQEVEAIVKKQGIVFSGVEAPQNEKDPYSIRYSEFVVPLVKAVQELSAKL
jgi:trimeric autotransporter adhesin